MYSLSPSNQPCMRKIQTAYISLKLKCEYSITSQINIWKIYSITKVIVVKLDSQYIKEELC